MTTIHLRWERSATSGPLFRYLPAPYARQMLVSGTVKVTTLHSCRVAEIGAAVVDAAEGRKKTIGIVDDVTGTGSHRRPASARGAVRVAEGQTTRLKDVVIEHVLDTDDYYVLCLSRTFDVALMRKLGVDACVRIDNPPEFFIRVTAALGTLVIDNGTMRAIQYGDRASAVETAPGVPSEWIKNPAFALQEEVRCLWTPAARPIRPAVVRIARPHEILRAEYPPSRS
jgi:hypothetical protein